MADKENSDFSPKQLYPDTNPKAQEKEDKQSLKTKAEFDRAQEMREKNSEQDQSEDQSEDQSDGNAEFPQPMPSPSGDMSNDANEIRRQTQLADEARKQEKINRHLELEYQKYENRQNEKENDNIRSDSDNSNER